MQVAERVVGERGEVDDGVEAVEVLGGDVADVGLAGGELGRLAPNGWLANRLRSRPTGSWPAALQERREHGADVAVVAGDEDLHGGARGDPVGDQPRERERGGGGGGGGVADVERALGLADTTKSSIRLPSRPSAWARTPAGPGRTSSAVQLRDVAGAVLDQRAAADGVAQLAQAGPPPAARHPVGAGPAQGLAQVPGGQALEVVGVARAGQQRGRADQDLVVGAAGEVDAEERQRRVGHRVDERAHEVAALGPQAQPGAAEGDDARVGARRRRRPRAGPTSAPAQKTAKRARHSPAGVADADAVGADVGALDRAATVTTSPPAARTSSANASATAWKSTTAVAGECSASTPRTCGSISAISCALQRGAARGRRWRGRGARARRAAGPRRRRARRSASRPGGPGCRAPRSRRAARGAPSVQRRALSEPGA